MARHPTKTHEVGRTSPLGAADLHATLSGPGIGEASSRWLAVSAGDFLSITRDEVERTLEKANGNRFKAIDLGLDRLYENGLINGDDLRSLNIIVEAVASATRKKSDPYSAFKTVLQTYHDMGSKQSTSPTALAIASVTCAVFPAAPPNATSKQKGITFLAVSIEDEAAAVTIGATIGAAVGGLLGGALGGTAGALIGGGIGGIVGECSD